jgi:hypothetical protein
MKKKFLPNFLLAMLMASFFIFTSAKYAFASLEITEIMYDLSGSDTGREWIEIYNPDSTPVDVTKIKLFEASTNHGVSVSSGSGTLNFEGYAVISDVPSKFMTDNPSYSGMLFDSTFSLSNTGEPLELRNASGTILDSVTYDSALGATGDGNSLQKINGAWTASAPTPGLQNIFVSTTSTSTSTTTGSSGTSTTTSTSTSTTTPSQSTQTTKIITKTVYISTHSSEEDLSDYNEGQVFETSAGRQRIAYVGAPIEFKASYKIPKSMESNTRKFDWSFGDGLSGAGEKVTHTYKYGGEYSVVLNSESGDKHAVSRTVVKVLSPNLALAVSSSGDIEISNRGNTEINLGLWKLRDTSNEFIFAQDSIVGAGKVITLSKDDTKILPGNNRISLENPSGREVFAIDNSNNIALSQVGADSDITVERAEALYAEYKKSLALKSKLPVNIENRVAPTSSGEDLFPKEKDLSQVATAIESVNSTTTVGFFGRLWRGSISRIKTIARLFYDF